MSKFVLCSVLLVVLVSMCQPINSFGIARVDVQTDPALLNAIGSAISSKIQSWNSILNSLLAIKSSYKTVNVNYGSNVASTSSGSSGSSNSGSSGSSSVVYNTIPLYRKTVNVNYGVAAAPISNTIEDSSDDDDTSSSSSSSPSSSSSTADDSSVANAGQTIFTATKIIGGVPAPAASSSSASTVSSGSATVAVVPSNVGYSYNKVVG